MAEYCPPPSSSSAAVQLVPEVRAGDEPTADGNAEDGAVASSLPGNGGFCPPPPPPPSEAATWVPEVRAGDEPTADGNAEDGAVASSLPGNGGFCPPPPPPPPSEAATWVPEVRAGDEPTADRNVEARALAMSLDRREKLLMLSKKAHRQDLAFKFSEWKGEEEGSSPNCAHLMTSHSLHLENAHDNEINRLLNLVFDLDYIQATLINLCKLPSNDRNYVLESVYFSMYLELKQFVFPGSIISLKNLFGVPPFENPCIVKILMNFNMYKFGYNSSQLKAAYKVSKIIIKHLDTWKWISPKYLLLGVKVENRKTYEFYYKRYIAFCQSPDHIQSIRPGFRMTTIFGKDVLKCILKTVCMSLLSWFLASRNEWSDKEKLIEMKNVPNYLSLLQNEIDADHSPIWDLNFKYSNFKNKIASNTLPEFEADEKNAEVQDEGIKNKSFDEEKIASSQEEECIDSSKDYLQSEETISYLLEKVHSDLMECANEIDLINASRGEKARIEEQKGTLRVVVIGNSVVDKVEKCVKVWLTQLRNIFRIQLPNMPLRYITNLVYDRNHKIVALLKNDNAVGGICFRPFASRGFSEIAFCAVSAEVQELYEYGMHLMNHLKDYQTQQNILDLLTYADEGMIGYFEKQGFSKNVTISKNIYQDCIKFYEGASLMHCRLNAKIAYSQLPHIIRLQTNVLKSLLEEKRDRFEEKVLPGLTWFKNCNKVIHIESIPGVLDARCFLPAKVPKNNHHEEIDFDVLTIKLTEVLTFVKGLKEAEPFLKPFDNNVPDYNKLISFPIDLSMISDQLSSGYYRSRMLFVADMKRMFTNCHKISPPDSYWANCATNVEKHYKKKMKELGLSLELST